MAYSRDVKLFNLKACLKAIYSMSGYYMSESLRQSCNDLRLVSFLEDIEQAQKKIRAYFSTIQIHSGYSLNRDDQSTIRRAFHYMTQITIDEKNTEGLYAMLPFEDKLKVQSILRNLVENVGEDSEKNLESSCDTSYDIATFKQYARDVYDGVFPDISIKSVIEEEKSSAAKEPLRPHDEKARFIRAVQDLATYIREHDKVQENAKKPKEKRNKEIADCLEHANAIFEAIVPFAEQKESPKKTTSQQGLGDFYKSTLSFVKQLEQSQKLRPSGTDIRQDGKVMHEILSRTKKMLRALYPHFAKGRSEEGFFESFVSLRAKLGRDTIDRLMINLTTPWPDTVPLTIYARQYTVPEYYCKITQQVEKQLGEYTKASLSPE